MQLLKITFLSFLFLIVSSCDITQETKFNADGSGLYSLEIDLSKFNSEKEFGNSTYEEIDTLIVFSDLIRQNLDSISLLKEEKQKELENLKDFSIALKSDSAGEEMKVKIFYNFKEITDLKTIKDKVSGLKDSKTNLGVGLLSADDGNNGFYELYNTTLSKKKFTLTPTAETIALASKIKEDSIIEEDPFMGVISFKSRFIFPYKIKKVNNKNAVILSDSMGIELISDILELRTNPNFFNLDIEFE